jgi:hypothetical protein
VPAQAYSSEPQKEQAAREAGHDTDSELDGTVYLRPLSGLIRASQQYQKGASQLKLPFLVRLLSFPCLLAPFLFELNSREASCKSRRMQERPGTAQR